MMYADDDLYDNKKVRPGGMSFRHVRTVHLDNGADLNVVNLDLIEV
jgi:hypothetical protein